MGMFLAESNKKMLCILEKIDQLIKKLPTQVTKEMKGIKLSNYNDSSSKKISIVFVGQYSSGKSSIIKMLTNDQNIKIGAEITTDIATIYEWNGIEIVDTPGIDTCLRPEHDEISKFAIANADLLLFVITSGNLFDQQLGDYFRKLAYENNKSTEIMLVVNKMASTALGNVPEQQNIITEGIQCVLAPKRPEEYHISYIDAQSFLKAKDIVEVRRVKRCINVSGYNQFIQTLNDFVKERGLIGKVTTPLYQANEVLFEIIEILMKDGNDKISSGCAEYLNRHYKLYTSLKNNIHRRTEIKIEKLVSDIKVNGFNIVNKIDSQVDKESINNDLKDIEAYIIKQINECQEEIHKIIDEELLNTDLNIERLEKSEFALDLGQIIMEESSTNGLREPAIKITKSIGKWCSNVDKKTVGEIAKLVGKKFKPWGLGKFTSKINKFGKFLGLLGPIIDSYFEYKDSKEEAKRMSALNEMKEALRNEFIEIADQLEADFKDMVNSYIEGNVMPHIDSIYEQLNAVRDLRKLNDICVNDAFKLLNESKSLIEELHKMK